MNRRSSQLSPACLINSSPPFLLCFQDKDKDWRRVDGSAAAQPGSAQDKGRDWGRVDSSLLAQLGMDASASSSHHASWEPSQQPQEAQGPPRKASVAPPAAEAVVSPVAAAGMLRTAVEALGGSPPPNSPASVAKKAVKPPPSNGSTQELLSPAPARRVPEQAPGSALGVQQQLRSESFESMDSGRGSPSAYADYDSGGGPSTPADLLNHLGIGYYAKVRNWRRKV